MQLITNSSMQEQKEHGSFNFPLLVSFEILSSYDSGNFLLHWHPEVELTLITAGEMIYRVNNHSIPLSKGDILFCNSGALHSGNMKDNLDCEYISITFNPKLIYGFEKSVIYDNYILPIIQDISLPYIYLDSSNDYAQTISAEITKISSLKKGVVIGYEFDIISSLYKIWMIIYETVPKKEFNPEVSTLNLSRFRSILSYIGLNYWKNIRLAELASHIHLCEEECCRLFKNVMNMSIFEYIQEYRIEKACEYLTETNHSITKIACMVGFNDPNYFSKTFKKYKYISPRQYRKELKS